MLIIHNITLQQHPGYCLSKELNTIAYQSRHINLIITLCEQVVILTQPVTVLRENPKSHTFSRFVLDIYATGALERPLRQILVALYQSLKELALLSLLSVILLQCHSL